MTIPHESFISSDQNSSPSFQRTRIITHRVQFSNFEKRYQGSLTGHSYLSYLMLYFVRDYHMLTSRVLFQRRKKTPQSKMQGGGIQC